MVANSAHSLVDKHWSDEKWDSICCFLADLDCDAIPTNAIGAFYSMCASFRSELHIYIYKKSWAVQDPDTSNW